MTKRVEVYRRARDPVLAHAYPVLRLPEIYMSNMGICIFLVIDLHRHIDTLWSAACNFLLFYTTSRL